MPQSLIEYMEDAPRRDAEYAKERAEAEAHEDAYFDALGELIEEHPIGRPIRRVVHCPDK